MFIDVDGKMNTHLIFTTQRKKSEINSKILCKLTPFSYYQP